MKKNAPGFCTKCERALTPDNKAWLELDQRTGTYTDQDVPAEFSQGAFEFGKDCAEIMLAEHAKANEPQAESVDLIAAGYEWNCPDPDCETPNREIEITETVRCHNCHKIYETNPPEHAYE